MTERALFIDGSSLAVRAFFAIPNARRTREGLPANAIFGVARALVRQFAARPPSVGAVVLRSTVAADTPDDLRAQLETLTQLYEAFGLPCVRADKVHDVLGSLSARARNAGLEVTLLASDKRLAQLVGVGTRMVDAIQDVSYDAELTRKKWGVPPEAMVTYLSLVGDETHGVEGVAGVGAKTAATVAAQHPTVDGLLGALDTLPPRARKAIEAHPEVLRGSERAARIDTAGPLPDGLGPEETTLNPPDPDRVDALLRSLDLHELLAVGSVTTTTPTTPTAVLDVASARVQVLSQGAITAVFPLVDPASNFDCRGLGLARADGWTAFVPLEGPPPADVAAWLASAESAKVTHDSRVLYGLCRRWGIELRGLEGDSCLGSYLKDPTAHLPHTLDQVARAHLARGLSPSPSGTGKAARALADLPTATLASWTGEQALAVALSWAALAPALAERQQDWILGLVELPLARLLADMHQDGIRVDVAGLTTLQLDLEGRRDAVALEIHTSAGHAFEIGSPQQLGTVLFDELGLPVLKRTKTGYSTDADVLDRLSAKHPIVPLVLRWRTLAKLVNTYTEVLRAAVNPDTGRVHATYLQTTSASGRLISTDPDLQRTPIRTEDGRRIREAFIARDGWLLLSADWSQIELRILAHLSGDSLLVDAFTHHRDVHRETAGRIFDRPPETVTAEQRTIGKTVNFATIYGQGATALGHQLGLSRAEAKAIIDRYFARYAGVRTWLDTTVAQAKERGFVETLLGRRRRIPELSSNNPTEYAYGERIAANTPVQGTAADLCKIAMLHVARDLDAAGLNARMLMQIHDELVLEAPPDEADRVEVIVREAMEMAWPLSVPLVVQVGRGASWGEAHG